MIAANSEAQRARWELEGLILEETTYGGHYVRHRGVEASLCLVLDGVLVERNGSEVVTCPARTLAIHPAGTHTLDRRSGDGSDVRCFEVHFDGTWLGRLRETGVSGQEPSSYLRVSRANVLVTQIRQEIRRPDVASAVAVAGLALALVAELRRLLPSGRGRQMPAWLRSAVETLHEQFREPLNMAALARQVGVHPVHLSRGFRKQFGITMTAYLRDLRMHFASEALLASEEPLARIARTAGYQDAKQFTRAFKAATGLTPSAYRQRSRGNGDPVES